MHIRHLSLVDFRSWPAVDLPLEPGPTVLVGRNGAGMAMTIRGLTTLTRDRGPRVGEQREGDGR